MSIQKKFDDKENAVSPVVGVMLMLVVTIIIAAVVAVFATGVVTTTQTAPTAVLSAGDFKVSPGTYGGLMGMTLVHKNGDTLAIDNLELQMIAFGAAFKYDATKMTSALGRNAISAGDSIIINVTGCGFNAGTPVEWTLVDTASGMGICSGKFVVPVGNYTARLGGFTISSGSVSIDGTGYKKVTISNPVDELGDPISTGFSYDVVSGNTNIATVVNDETEATVTISGVDEGVCNVSITGKYGGASVTKVVSVTVASLDGPESVTSGSPLGVITFTVPSSYTGNATLTASSGYTLNNGNPVTAPISSGVAKFNDITVTGTSTTGKCTLTATVTKKGYPDAIATCEVTVS